MDQVLEYFNPNKPQGRNGLAILALILAILAVLGSCLILPGLLFSAAALWFSLKALKQIDHEREIVAYSLAQFAFLLGGLVFVASLLLAGIAIAARLHVG